MCYKKKISVHFCVVKLTIILPWLAPPHCVASEQLLQTWACDCGSESPWVLEQYLVSLALCIGGRSCAEWLLFCWINTVHCVGKIITHTAELAVFLHIPAERKTSKKKKKNSPLTLGIQHQQSDRHLSWEWPTQSSYLWPSRRILHLAHHRTDILTEHEITIKRIRGF